MPKLTITIDGTILKKARLRALAEGASVDKVLRGFLESYVRVRAERSAALDDLLALSREARSRHGRGGRWSREELHERDSCAASSTPTR